MQRDEFIKGLNSNLQLTNRERDIIIERFASRESHDTLGIICMEECAELQQQISKLLRGNGNVNDLLEEMADVYICLNLLERMLYIPSSMTQKAIDVKLERERRRQNEHYQ